MAASENSIRLANIAAEAASDIKATSAIAVDVSERLIFAEVFLILSGSNERQVRAIVSAVEEALDEAGGKRQAREGYAGEARWVLLDYGDVIVHILHDEDREYYALDKLWADCPAVELGARFGEDIEEAHSLAQYAANRAAEAS